MYPLTIHNIYYNTYKLLWTFQNYTINCKLALYSKFKSSKCFSVKNLQFSPAHPLSFFLKLENLNLNLNERGHFTEYDPVRGTMKIKYTDEYVSVKEASDRSFRSRFRRPIFRAVEDEASKLPARFVEQHSPASA